MNALILSFPTTPHIMLLKKDPKTSQKLLKISLISWLLCESGFNQKTRDVSIKIFPKLNFFHFPVFIESWFSRKLFKINKKDDEISSACTLKYSSSLFVSFFLFYARNLQLIFHKFLLCVFIIFHFIVSKNLKAFSCISMWITYFTHFIFAKSNFRLKKKDWNYSWFSFVVNNLTFLGFPLRIYCNIPGKLQH